MKVVCSVPTLNSLGKLLCSILILINCLNSCIRPCLADKELQCLVCRSVVDEIEYDIKKVNPKQTVDIGGFRLDSNGNQKKSQIKYAYSEMHMHDVLEKVCSRMDDYAQAKYKETGERTIIKLTNPDGSMNSDTIKVDFTPDEGLNTKLKFYCESLVDEYEDDIIRIFTKQEKDADLKLCAQAAGYCPGSIEDDEYDFEKEEL
ncbi:Protein canopy 2 [Chamberlinius hualienensis]